MQHIEFFSENPKGRHLLENLYRDSKIILQVVLRTNRLLSSQMMQTVYKMIQENTRIVKLSHKPLIFQNKESRLIVDLKEIRGRIWFGFF